MNKVIISGNLGQKPEVRKANSGNSVGNFSVATNQRVKKGDEWVDNTEWHRIVVFGKTAENCERFLDKGSKVIVEGRIQYRSYEDKEGNQRKATEIVANNVEFMTKPENGVSRQQARPAPTSNYNDEEIPF
jgi:single-strand DNA-binding protein